MECKHEYTAEQLRQLQALNARMVNCQHCDLIIRIPPPAIEVEVIE